jgi:16S rRNA (guanine527-N7)-methyltransferase
MTPQAALERGLGELAPSRMPGHAFESLLGYVELLAKWNRVHNLTAIRDPFRMVSHHVLDSLATLPHLPPGRLADVGSGGGSPGIPIAIAQPERAVTLNDASLKKSAFLRQAVLELKLANAEVHAGRVESWHPVERYQVVISRAFGSLAQFLAACRHLLAPDGCLAAMKGTFPSRELTQVQDGMRRCAVHRLRVPLLNAERHLVLCTPGSAA